MLKPGAGNETRTRDPDLGKVVLYQLSYSRLFKPCAPVKWPCDLRPVIVTWNTPQSRLGWGLHDIRPSGPEIQHHGKESQESRDLQQ